MSAPFRSRLWTPPLLLDRWLAAGLIGPLDYQFAAAMASLASEPDAQVVVTLALLSRSLGAGHVCLDLRRPIELGPLQQDADAAASGAEPLAPLDGTLLRERLRRSALVSESLDQGDGPSALTPVVMDSEGRIYLRRYADYQARLARNLLARAARTSEIDEETLTAGIQSLFERGADGSFGEQALAAWIVASRPFALISGGPGTGKTSTVLKLLTLLQRQQLERGAAPRKIALLAPTGKAAARLGETLRRGLTHLTLEPRVRASLAVEPKTIHRALGYLPSTPTRFAHDAEHPLPEDVVVVDEASMIDLALMTKLVEAVRPDARLILLGDKDQLHSVEAGAILGDIYGRSSELPYSSALVENARRRLGIGLSAAASSQPKHLGLRDCMIHLDRSYRYARDSGIARLAASVNQGDSKALLEALEGGRYPDLEWSRSTPDPARDLRDVLLPRARTRFSDLWQEGSVEGRLRALGHFRVLCPHRRGPAGAESFNASLEEALHLCERPGDSYDGRPVLVTENDYGLDLYNGDTGVMGRDATGLLRVYFEGPKGPRSFLPARLPAHQSVYSMTIHSSQGSEFDEILIILPHEPSPLLCRELLYTAITRARKRVVIHASEASLCACINRRIERTSGLADALWGTAEL